MLVILTKFCKKTEIQDGGHATEPMLTNFDLNPACCYLRLSFEKQQIYFVISNLLQT